VTAYDDLLSGAFQQFKDLSVKIGGDVKTMVIPSIKCKNSFKFHSSLIFSLRFID
jgi:hypothetical protein